jgi:two-component system NarL family sensor kinase
LVSRPLLRRPRPGSRSEVVSALLTYGLLCAYVAAVYVLILASGGVKHGRPTSTWPYIVATIAVVATVEPVRRWLRGSVEELVYAHHENAYDALVLVQRELDSEPAVEESSLAAIIARSVNVPFVALQLAGETTQSYGELVIGTEPIRVPLTFRGDQLGVLLAGPRKRGLVLSAADQRLLRDLASQLAVSLFAQRAAAEVLESRTQLVTAREEERRRIRRDLHDGLGPTLAAMQLELKAIQRLLPDEPDRASAIVDELLSDVRNTTADIRRLVYDLRPPMLDDLGLVGALRSSAMAPPGCLLTIVAGPEIASLPAAVEVALYRIAAESIQNAAKHAAAETVNVSIAVHDDTVRLTVVDDGRGLPSPLVAGVGLAAIRERAEELGGVAVIESALPSGTRVAVELPLRKVSS